MLNMHGDQLAARYHYHGMSDRVITLMVQHGLIWLVAAILIIGSAMASAAGLAANNSQFACAAAMLVMSVGVLFTWRRYIRWTRSKAISTGAMSVLLVAQLVIWRPI